MGVDITDCTQDGAAVQQAAGRFGRLGTLVNNAGLMLLGPVADADPEEWDRVIAINVQGTPEGWFCTGRNLSSRPGSISAQRERDGCG